MVTHQARERQPGRDYVGHFCPLSGATEGEPMSKVGRPSLSIYSIDLPGFSLQLGGHSKTGKGNSGGSARYF
jgi:hypothetical protein